MVCLSQFLFLGLMGLTQGAPADVGVVSQGDAINYMKQWRPKEDGVSEEFFRVNADLALKTKDLPYANQVSKEMFLKYVLPYSHFDEPRDDWRPKMYETLLPFVKDKKNLQQAAEALFPAWGNAFGKQLQFKGDMTPQVMAPLTQTLNKGFASCTGMSIFLADCMRAVGIPARIVGVTEWNRPEKGNHNWVEIWMGDHWNFVDAVPTGELAAWNKTWFSAQAAKQSSSPSVYAIMSPLWGSEAHSVYNISWRTPSVFVPAIDVTASYGGAHLLQAGASASSLSGGFMLPGIAIIVFSALGLGGAGYAYKVNKDHGGYTQLP